MAVRVCADADDVDLVEILDGLRFGNARCGKNSGGGVIVSTKLSDLDILNLVPLRLECGRGELECGCGGAERDLSAAANINIAVLVGLSLENIRDTLDLGGGLACVVLEVVTDGRCRDTDTVSNSGLGHALRVELPDHGNLHRLAFALGDRLGGAELGCGHTETRSNLSFAHALIREPFNKALEIA